MEKEEFLESIEASNEVFDKLSIVEKRVEVAKDVLTRIHLNMIKPRRGVFFDFSDYYDKINKESINQYECKVCAKGALFAAFVGRVNNFNSIDCYLENEPYCDEGAHDKLTEIFSWEQLALIELAFEGIHYLDKDSIGNEIFLDSEIERNAKDFFRNYPIEKQNERLIAICENIINNNGTFIP